MSTDDLDFTQIIGEMAMVSRQPRSATALARTPCRAIALDARQFQGAIQKMPEFALMLMSTTINRTDFLALVKTRPDFAMSMLRTLADRLRFLTSNYG